MKSLKFEIDMEEMFEDGLEAAIANSVLREANASFRQKAIDMITEKTDAMIQAAVDYAVEQKINNLMNEPVAISDRWGKKVFVGSVEDYIKKEIDAKLLAPVDDTGKILTGCSTAGQKTWVEWKFEKLSKTAIDYEIKRYESKISSQAEKIAKEALADIVDKSTKESISKAISSLITK